MTVRKHRLRISIVTTALVMAGAVCADHVQAQTVPLTLNLNLQFKNLHPAVTRLQIFCSAPMPSDGTVAAWTQIHGRTPWIPVVNRAYSGVVPLVIDVAQALLVFPVNRSPTVTCITWLGNIAGPEGVAKLSTTAEPESISNETWLMVPADSVTFWTQKVTFPNANAATAPPGPPPAPKPR